MTHLRKEVTVLYFVYTILILLGMVAYILIGDIPDQSYSLGLEELVAAGATGSQLDPKVYAYTLFYSFVWLTVLLPLVTRSLGGPVPHPSLSQRAPDVSILRHSVRTLWLVFVCGVIITLLPSNWGWLSLLGGVAYMIYAETVLMDRRPNGWPELFFRIWQHGFRYLFSLILVMSGFVGWVLLFAIAAASFLFHDPQTVK